MKKNVFGGVLGLLWLLGAMSMTVLQVQRQQVYTQKAARLYEISQRPLYTASVDNADVAAPAEILVKYKDGYTPQELEEQQAQEVAQSQTLPGAISNGVGDFVAVMTGEETTEDTLEKIEAVEESVGVTSSTPLIDEAVVKDEALQEQVDTIQLVQAKEDTSVAELANTYNALPEVEYAQPNYYFSLSAAPNDPYYHDGQWNMKTIGMEQAWDIESGNTSVAVAVVDSGIDSNHPDLAGKVTSSVSFAQGSTNDPLDHDGHGTFIAGLIGASVGNSVGIAGMNKTVSILNVKIFNTATEQTPVSTAVQGIVYAIAQNAKVINFSAAPVSGIGCGDMPGFQDALNQAAAQNIVFVQAAGNSNVDASEGCTNRLLVGATNNADQRASYSNWGSSVHISAPGGDSTQCQTCGLTSLLHDSRVGYGDGTSFAAPQVAGAAALLLAINPSLTVQQVRDTLISTADPITTDKPIGPRLNVSKALQTLRPLPTPVVSPTIVVSPTVEQLTPTPTVDPALSVTPTVSPTLAPTGITTPTVAPSPTPTSSPIPTQTPTPTQIPTPPLTPTPTMPQTPTVVAFSFTLPGVGATGNTSPNNQSRDVMVQVFSGDQKVGADISAEVIYTNGVFSGTVNMGTIIPSGSYSVKIKASQALSKTLAKSTTVTAGTTNTLQPTALVLGDINNDNKLDILDYNIFAACFGAKASSGECNGKHIDADLNDDGGVDGVDYNIFLAGIKTAKEGE